MQKQQITAHAWGFSLTLIAAFLFYLDIHLQSASTLYAIVDFFGFDQRFKLHVAEGSILAFYFGVTVVNFFTAVLCALYFFCRNGHQQNRYEFYGFSFLQSILGNLVPFCVTLILSLFFIGVIWFGGILLGYIFPAKIYLDMIPGFVVLQILFMAKVQGILTTFLNGTALMLLPFELHPLRFKIFNLKLEKGENHD